jgi:hypothetical protein
MDQDTSLISFSFSGLLFLYIQLIDHRSSLTNTQKDILEAIISSPTTRVSRFLGYLKSIAFVNCLFLY